MSRVPRQRQAAVDRKAVVTRHNIDLAGPDASRPLQVGNGDFAFTMDITGVQTFYGNSLSSWGWHEFPSQIDVRADRVRTEVWTHGRRRRYLAPGSDPYASTWYTENPHRMNLGRLRFVSVHHRDPGVRPLLLEEISQTHQHQDLWRGEVTSRFRWRGCPVVVETVCHPTQDQVAVRVESPALASTDDDGLGLAFDFPYPVADGGTPYLGDWTVPSRHASTMCRAGENRMDVARHVDATSYHASIVAEGGLVQQRGRHEISVRLREGAAGVLCVVWGCAPQPLPDPMPPRERIRVLAGEAWSTFWNDGAAVDFSDSVDSRWFELERRVVLSQQVTAMNSSGSAPPQESGLLWNSWCGKFHLEMTAWHGAHFLLWNRGHLLAGWFGWLNEIGLPAARREACAEGWRGAKWLKTPDHLGRWESWEYGPNRITQNAHPFLFAELCYRSEPSERTLSCWRAIVFETATMMADMAAWDGTRYVLGPPVMSGAEGNPGWESFNVTSELNYWAFSLEVAQRWRERLGLARDPQWERVRTQLSTPPVRNGVYIDAESHPTVWNRSDAAEWTSTRYIRPAWFESLGCLPGPLVDKAVMAATYDRAAPEIRSGQWNDNIWGCDFPMLAMTAARLGRPGEAVDWLLADAEANTYSTAGFCGGWYLPGNGGLLWAVAMMAGGWDGALGRHAPGFPRDGSWRVHGEGFQTAI